MSKIKSPRQVKYLALEGGGGKGITYLGAIQALEQLQVLPLDIQSPNTNQIKGISGASAGAIIGLFLAMGLSASELENILNQPNELNGFFDDPAIGNSRMIDKDFQPTIFNTLSFDDTSKVVQMDKYKKIKTLQKLASTVAYIFQKTDANNNDPILQKLIQHPKLYAYNLIFDKGLFPGFAVRSFLREKVNKYLISKIKKDSFSETNLDGGTINFETFYKLTGVDLVVTGSNISNNQPAAFSKRLTPLFPVIEAVGISMNLPLIFKPVFVEWNNTLDNLNKENRPYQGLWVDGAVLNNFPLHAFNYLVPPISKKYPYLRPLNQDVLGLRLVNDTKINKDEINQANNYGIFDILKGHVGNIFNTLLHPSGTGQIRTTEEAEQTVELCTYNLELTNFSPSSTIKKKPIENAEKTVLSYFN
ncbi:MAG: patatin-like phospholipase family protein [Bacteroidota bacterium]